VIHDRNLGGNKAAREEERSTGECRDVGLTDAGVATQETAAYVVTTVELTRSTPGHPLHPLLKLASAQVPSRYSSIDPTLAELSMAHAQVTFYMCI
jgi:hypothetical protein